MSRDEVEIFIIQNKNRFGCGDVVNIAKQLDGVMHENERLRDALVFIRDIEKPAVESPELVADWLGWYTTSSQQTEKAAAALSNKEEPI